MEVRLTQRHRFFHWELEFPDVFLRERPGFDAVLGNPPWDIQKPNSKEFFSNWDPIYRTYGKQEALDHQQRLFAQDPSIEAEWVHYSAFFKAMSNWVGDAADPADVALARGKEGRELSERWRHLRAGRRGYKAGPHPFRHQGSADINTYKLFLETAHHLLRDSGRLGFIVPSGIYTDKGATDLRRLFLDQSRWEWLFTFENRKEIFPIHRSFKFGPILVTKGGTTGEVRAAFMRHDLGDWEAKTPPHLWIPRVKIARFSPNTLSFMEFKSRRDLEICEKIYADHPLLGDKVEGGWNVEFAREFDMTNDSKLFPPRPEWERKGYRPDPYGRWVGPDGDIALPLYEGRMIGQFDFSQKGWVSGKGRSAVWREIPWDAKTIEPQYLMAQSDYLKNDKAVRGPKIGFMEITSATNARTMVSTLLDDFPCGHKVPVLNLASAPRLPGCLRITAILNSFIYDFVVRRRCGGLALSWFIVEELPVPRLRNGEMSTFLDLHVARMTLLHRLFAREWLFLRDRVRQFAVKGWMEHWAVQAHERLRTRCLIEAVIAELYGLTLDDLEFILKLDESDPTGFWRVDKGLPVEQRLPTLVLHAFRHLKDVGLAEFFRSEWQLPDHVKQFPRGGVSAWTPTEDWPDCKRHAQFLSNRQSSATGFARGTEGSPFDREVGGKARVRNNHQMGF